MHPPFLTVSGYCSTCNQASTFVAADAWLRDNFICSNCHSIPRERALMQVIEQYFPDWRSAVIHESSPAGRGASARLASECPRYTPSQFFPGQVTGILIDGMRSENLEELSFANESVDLHVTQDVLEHVFHPSKVFAEIARTLKPGGMHIFTAPLVNKQSPSRLRATIEGGNVRHLEPAMYHGNPVGDGRALVTIDWGFDICRKIFESSGLYTQLIYIDDLSKGIRAEYIEVLVTAKPRELDSLNEIP